MKMLQLIDHLGKSSLDVFHLFFKTLLFFYLVLRDFVKLNWSSLKSILLVTISQIYFTGCQALPLMGFIALAVGSIVTLQSMAQLSFLGSQEMMGKIMVVTIVRELGPLLTALIVIARSGTAVASELGNMRVNKEIDSLRSMSISPLSYVVFPRILGGVISLICLAFYFNMVSFIGGFMIAGQISELSFSFYTEVLSYALQPQDLFLNLLKNATSGLIIFTIACQQGLMVKSAPHEVPIATTKSVVSSIVTVVSFNLLVTAITYSKDLLL